MHGSADRLDLSGRIRDDDEDSAFESNGRNEDDFEDLEDEDQVV